MPGTGYPIKNRNAKYNIPMEEKLAADAEKADLAEKAIAESEAEKKAEDSGNSEKDKDAAPAEE
jgi:hypothetical protein